MNTTIPTGYENLIIEGIDGIIHIEYLEINQSVNDHARIQIRLLLEEQHARNYEGELLDNRDICLRKVDGEIIYYGIIVNSEINKTGGVYWLTISASSHTILMDLEKKTRSWQNINMTKGELLERIIKAYPMAAALCEDEFGKAPIGKFLLQFEETDWEFIRRVAALSNLSLFPERRRQGSSFSVGIPQTQKVHQVEHYHYRLRQNLDINQRIRYNNTITELAEADSLEYELKGVEEQYGLGERVLFQGGQFVICEVHAVLCQREGILLSDYWIRTEGGCRQERRYNTRIKGNSVPGTVLDVSRGYTRLHLHMDEEQPVEQACWFVQPSFYTGKGGYCAMPERGDVLNLHFPTEEEGDCYIISSQGSSFDQIEGQISGIAGGDQLAASKAPAECISKNKIWTTPGGNGLLLNDGQIGLHTKGKSAQISLDAGGITVSSEEGMELTGKSIALEGGISPCLKVEGTATAEMTFECGGSSILMDGGSGKFHVRGDEIFIESPLNPPPPELPDPSEVNSILQGYEDEKAKLRPIAYADGTIINAEEGLLYDYFMQYVYDDGSGNESYYDFVNWRKELYGLNKTEKRKKYVLDSAEFIAMGNYTDKVTGLGIAGSIVLGIFGGDAPLDIRDLTHNITHWENSWSHVGETALNAMGVIPVIGVIKNIKYLDEAGALIKGVSKAENLTDTMRLLKKGESLKFTDELGQAFQIRKLDNGLELLDASGNVLKSTDNIDDIIDSINDLYKGSSKVELNAPTKVKTNKGIEVEFNNPSGNIIKYVEQNSKNIPNAIESAQNSSNVGKAIEGKVGNFVQQKTEVTGFGLEVLNSSGGKVTDLDVVTNSQIIEVKKSASSLKTDQIDRLIDQTNPQFFNYDNKEVIIYIEESIDGITNPKTLEKIQYIQEKGVKIVNSLDELEGVLK